LRNLERNKKARWAPRFLDEQQENESSGQPDYTSAEVKGVVEVRGVITGSAFLRSLKLSLGRTKRGANAPL